jgi:hypothetical protein
VNLFGLHLLNLEGSELRKLKGLFGTFLGLERDDVTGEI